ncbi:MAG TPA: hypothetical protein DIV86_06890 [Alphaproteobacteria bacterium]|nr:hypothetical protein [Alphaproteobacteria bacterium]
MYALNALLHDVGLGQGEKYFPSVPGRNKALAAFDVTTMIRLDEIMKNDETKKNMVVYLNDRITNKKSKMPDLNFYEAAEAYQPYNNLLKEVNKRLFKNDKDIIAKFKQNPVENLTEYPFITEMILFYFADKNIVENLVSNYPRYAKAN